jgi:hypothetical protein
MDDLSAIFSSAPATQVFYIGTIGFMLAYSAGFLLWEGRRRSRSRASERRPSIRHANALPAIEAREPF